MVPGRRRGSGCADCSSPERYRYPSPIRETTHYQPRRNLPSYDDDEDDRVNHHNVGPHEYREPVADPATFRQPYQANPNPYPQPAAVHQLRRAPPHPSRGEQPARGQNAYNHQHQQPPPPPPAPAYPAYAEYTSTNQQFNDEVVAPPVRGPPPARSGRAEQPLATGPRPASTDRYAAAHCAYDHPIPMELKCANNYDWTSGKYVRDECGSGVVTTPCGSRDTRDNWCKTPLSIYQSSIGELGRKLLCGEIRIPPKIMGPPPCNVCEEILPPCHGYYRRYERLPACEEMYAKMSGGRKVYRDRVARYWEPCDWTQSVPDEDIRNYSGQNAYLAMKLNIQPQDSSVEF